jgi:hypothetical protein
LSGTKSVYTAGAKWKISVAGRRMKLGLKHHARWLFIWALAMCAWPFPFFPSLGSPNEMSRLYLARAMVDDGSFSLDGPVARYGRITDLAQHQGRFYSDKAPGTGMAGAAVYALIKAAGGWQAEKVDNVFLMRWLRLFLAALPAAGCTVLVFVLLGKFLAQLSSRLLLAGAYLCATVAYPYGVLLFGHQAAAFWPLLAVWLLWRQEPGPKHTALAGAALGMSPLFEYTTFILVLPLALWAIWLCRKRPSLIAGGVGGALVPLGLLAFYHLVCFGSLFSPGYGHLFHEHFAQIHSRGLLGLVTPSAGRLADVLFGTTRGLLFFSPWLVLAPAGMAWGLWKKDGLLWAVAALALCGYVVFSASLQVEAWGWSFGPRHLVPLMPFLVLAAGRLLAEDCRWRSWTGVALWAMIPYSAAVIIPPTLVFGGFPPDFSNPLSEFIGPLLARGCSATSLGEQLGLNRWFSLMVPAILTVWMLARSFFLEWENSRKNAFSIIAAAVFVFLAYSVTGTPSEHKTGTLRWMEKDILHCSQSPPQ